VKALDRIASQMTNDVIMHGPARPAPKLYECSLNIGPLCSLPPVRLGNSSRRAVGGQEKGCP
jgi:hypothetical protein